MAQALQSPKPEHPWLSKRAKALRNSHASASPQAASWKGTQCKDTGDAMHIPTSHGLNNALQGMSTCSHMTDLTDL